MEMEAGTNRIRILFWVLIALVVFVLAGCVIHEINNYALQYNDTVMHYSDTKPRIGNNVYGYIDVPEGYIVEGSFNPYGENYLGGADGIAEGIKIQNETGESCITVSIVSGTKQEHVGFGNGVYVTFGQRKEKIDTMEFWGECMDKLLDTNIMVREKDGQVSGIRSVEVNEIIGDISQWKSRINGKTYENVTYILPNPNGENIYYVLTASFTKGNEEIVDYLNTFSLTMDAKQQHMVTGVADRVGDSGTGYINVPMGYAKEKDYLYYEWVTERRLDSDVSYIYDESVLEEDMVSSPSVPGKMIIAYYEKSDLFAQDPYQYMDENFYSLLQFFTDCDYKDKMAMNIKLQETEFNAKTFVNVMEQWMGQYGKFAYEPAQLDGKNGYKIVWQGRSAFTYEQLYLSCYILEDSRNPEKVYVIGAEERNGEGMFWQYLESFSTVN